MLGLLLCTAAQGGIIKGPYSPTGDSTFGGGDVLHTDSPTLSGLGTVLQNYTLTFTLIESALSESFDGSLTLNNNTSPFQSLSALQGTTGTPNGDNFDYTLSFGPSSSGLIGLNPNALWTLTLQDSAGAGTLVNWSLDITAVPEPVNVALGIFAGVFVVGGLCRTERVRNLFRRSQVGVTQWLDAA
jgi:hypothetical protein